MKRSYSSLKSKLINEHYGKYCIIKDDELISVSKRKKFIITFFSHIDGFKKDYCIKFDI